jgi:prepilin-type N-terminal cleavage/methylation domain-containing protein
VERHRSAEHGFSIVEVIIAMFLLALVAVALLPSLFQGIQYSTQQSAVATATRQLNSLIEQARQAPSCGALASAAATRNFTDGAGRTLTSSGVVGACATKTAVAIKLAAVDGSGTTLATSSALIYIP